MHLRLVPQVGQGDEAQPSAHALHPRALVVAGNGARCDGSDVRVALLDKCQQGGQILHLIALGVLVHEALCLEFGVCWGGGSGCQLVDGRLDASGVCACVGAGAAKHTA